MIRKTNINFLGPAKFLTPISITLAFLSLAIIFGFGFSYGIDFAGGNEIQIQFSSPVSSTQIKQALNSNGIDDVILQKLGTNNEFLIRTETMTDETQNNQKLELLNQTLQNHFKQQGFTVRRIDSIGPQIGKELRRSGVLALIYSLLMILIYLGVRFDAKYAPSAVFCLFHDAMVTMSIFSLFRLEVNVQTLAAILAIIGYSLNDTIVTFDRIRENYHLAKDKTNFFAICNQSLNEVLSRTLLTSITTLLAITAMYVFAEGIIRDFAFTLGIGIVIGTYSSVYVATPLLLFISKLQKSSLF